MGLRGAGLGSSGIGASLHRLVTIIPWHPRASGSWPSYRRGPGKLSGHRHPAATAPPSLRVFPASRCVKSSPDATTQAGWLAPGDSTDRAKTVPRALYGLRVLAANDSAAFAAVQADLRRADPSCAAAVALLLNGYTQGQRWYADPVGFFLMFCCSDEQSVIPEVTFTIEDGYPDVIATRILVPASRKGVR